MKLKSLVIPLIVPVLFSFCLSCFGADPDQDNESETYVEKTHIEYSPFGLTKIEIPFPVKSREEPESKDFPSTATKTLQTSIFGIVGASAISSPPYEVQQVNILKIPFFQFLTPLNAIKMTSGEENPFKETFQFDESLFCVYEGMVVSYRQKGDPGKDMFMLYNEGDESPEKIKCIRRRFLDSLVFRLYEKAAWGDGYYDVEFLDIPLITTLAHLKAGNSSSWQILETPLTTLYTNRVYMKGRSVRIIDLWAAELYHRDSDKDSRDFEVLDSWVATLIKSHAHKNNDRYVFTFLETPKILFNWTRFSLWKSERAEDNTSSRQLLKLPILGPVWSCWKEDKYGKTHHGIFPRIFFRHAPKHAR